MSRTVKDLEEAGVIALFANGPSSPLPAEFSLWLGNGDDAAVFSNTPGSASVITTDSLIEGQHYSLSFGSPEGVGHRLAHVNLSDLASMGAKPGFALLSVALRADTPEAELRGIAKGFHGQLKAHGVSLIGGNTTKTEGPNMLTAVFLGAVPPHGFLRRDRSRIGDLIFVSGTLGDALGGLQRLLAGKREASDDPAYASLYQAQLRPEAEVALGIKLRESGLLHAMTDVSDGLATDLRNLLAPEGLGAIINEAALPISEALQMHAKATVQAVSTLALFGGEEYGLLFTAPEANQAAIEALGRACGRPLTAIGQVCSEGFFVLDPKGDRQPLLTGFQHYSKTL